MRTHARTLFTLCTLAALAAWSSVTLAGDGYRLVAHEDASVLAEEVTRLQGEVAKMDDLRAQMASLQTKLDASLAHDAHGGDCGCSSCCNCCCVDPCCRSQGWTVGAELLWLKPHDTNGTGLGILNNVGPPVFGNTVVNADTVLDPEFETSYRLWAGYQLCDGLGVRVRYWEFDHSFSQLLYAGAEPFVTQGWDVWALDIEATASTRLGCNWDVTASAGFRYVDFQGDRSYSDGLVTNLAASNEFSGYGLTTSFEIRRQVTCSLLGFANVRGSVVMGDETNTDHFDDGVGGVLDVVELQRNDVKFIYEAQIGAEYAVPMACGGWYYVRAGAELQYWDSMGTPTPFGPLSLVTGGLGTNNDNGSTGFGGFFFTAGVAR